MNEYLKIVVPDQIAFQLLDQGAFLFDIRTKDEYCKGHIRGSILVPTALPPLSERELVTLKDQLWWVTKQYNIPKKYPIIVYCKKGKRAKVAVEMLKSMGFDQAYSWGGVDENLKELFKNKFITCSVPSA